MSENNQRLSNPTKNIQNVYLMLDYEPIVGTVRQVIQGGYDNITIYDKKKGITRENKIQLTDKFVNLCFNTKANYIIQIPHNIPEEVKNLITKISEVVEFDVVTYVSHSTLLNDEYAHIFYDATYVKFGHAVDVFSREKCFRITGDYRESIIRKLINSFRLYAFDRRVHFVMHLPNEDTKDDWISSFDKLKISDDNSDLIMLFSVVHEPDFEIN